MTRKVLVLGSGKRVRETALPALAACSERFELTGVWARTAKTVESHGRPYEVRAVADLTDAEISAADLVCMAVGKDAVPEVLARLVRADLSTTDLLIDTPVVRFKHFRHTSRLARFRNAWVAEDTTTLPWMDAVARAVEAGAVGALREVVFFQSAYAYHALATAKTLLGCNRIRSARRERLGGRIAVRRLRFANGTRARAFEPRDYASGRLLLVGTKGSISDFPYAADGNLVLEPVASGGTWSGFRVGDHASELSEAEARLLGPGGGSVTSRMDDLKRVGFLRLLEAIDDGRGAYPVDEAIDDMVVDYHLEKVGRYVANPFTSSRSGLARTLLRAATR